MNTRRTIGEVPGSSGSVSSRGPAEDRVNGAVIVDWAGMISGDAPIVRRAQTICRSLTQRLRNSALTLLFSACLCTVGAYAGNATWNGSGSAWQTAGNWSPNGAPTGIATFGTASITAITSNATITNIDTLQFSSGAPAYSFAIITPGSMPGFNINGTGIVNSSSNAPTFTVAGALHFTSSNGTTSAGNSTITTNSTGSVVFMNTSLGGQARFITNAGGIFDISGLSSVGTTAGSIEGAGTYQLGSKALTVGGNNLSTGVSGNIVDGGFSNGTGASLVKVGTGTLTLSGANTYTGVTTVSAGTLQAGSTTGFSASSAFTVTSSSTLDIKGSSNTVGSLAGTGKVTNSAGSTSATLTAGGNNTSTTFSGTLVNGSGTLGLTKTGTGTLALSGANTYSGATTVSVGTLQAGSITAFSGNSAFTVASSSTLDIKGFSNTLGSLAGTGKVTNSAGSTSANLTAGANNTSTTFSGNLINGVGMRVTKIGTGTLTLSGANNNRGFTTVSAGTLQAGSTTAFSGLSAFTVNSTLDLHGFSNSVGSLDGAGTVTNSGTSTSATLTAGGNNFSTTFSGILANGAGILGLTKAGTGTLTLSGADTYGGATTVSTGTLQADSITAFSANSDFTVNTTLDLNGNSNFVGSLAGSGTVLDGTGTLKGAATLNAGGDNNNPSTTFSGTIVNGTGTLGLTKSGTGTLTLTGASTYTGTTTVSAGTLQVDGGLGNTAVTVQSGAILTGKGAIAGNVTILGDGHLSPGPGAETLGVGNLVLSSSSILDYQLSNAGVIGSGVNSLINVTGNLTLDGVLKVTDGGLFSSGLYRLINYSGALTNNTLALGSCRSGSRRPMWLSTPPSPDKLTWS
jgi:fibronectin-binding autotransporter adhesin